MYLCELKKKMCIFREYNRYYYYYSKKLLYHVSILKKNNNNLYNNNNNKLETVLRFHDIPSLAFSRH